MDENDVSRADECFVKCDYINELGQGCRTLNVCCYPNDHSLSEELYNKVITEQLVEDGWTTVGDKDYCPTHSLIRQILDFHD